MSWFGLMAKMNKKIIVGYCPTMVQYASHLGKTKNIQLTEYQSSQDALESLANSKIGLVIIGRKARPEEMDISSKYVQVFDQANTLVLFKGQDSTDPSIIDWEDVDYSRMELVVPTYEDGSKIEKYRTPFIYYNEHIDNYLISQFTKIIKGAKS